MSTTVHTEDGTFEWLNDYDNEKVDPHAHQSDDIPVPLVLQKNLTSNENYIECKDENNVEKFSIQGDGTCVANGTFLVDTIQAKDLLLSDGLAMVDECAIGFVPYDELGNSLNREYRFGRAKNIGDYTHEGDGLQFFGTFPKNGVDKHCAVQIGIAPSEPAISIRGFKNTNERFFEIKDEEGGLIFAVSADGHILGNYIVDPSGAQDQYNGSSVNHAHSVYIGPSRLSYTNSKLRFYTLKSNHIPTVLAASPYNVSSVPSSVSTSDDKIHEWMVVARTLSGNDTVRIASIFPAANLASDFDESTFAESSDVYTKAEVDQDVATLQTDINTKQDTLSAAQLAVCNADAVFSTAQANAITANTAKTGISAAQSSAIVANTAKVGITTAQSDQIVSNTANIAAAASGTLMTSPSHIYVDGSRTETYTETGAINAPYKTLQAACTAHLVDGSSIDIVFIIKPGTYNIGSGISFHQSSKTQNVTFRGDGSNQDTEIWCTDITTDAIYLRNFRSVTFSNLTIWQCKYGLYIRDTTKVTIKNCRFWRCGSTSSASVHRFSNTLAEQLAHWQDASKTSNGGACRIQTTNCVAISDNYVWRTLRGIRVQDVRHSLGIPSYICNNQINETLESALYLASSNYAFGNVYGCRDIFITGNRIYKPYNNGLLLIGSARCEVTNNQIIEPANAGIQQWSSTDIIYKNNYIKSPCGVLHNGIGSLGDCWGAIVLAGNSGITATSGSKIATVQSNHSENCQQGRANSVINIRVLESNIAYPAGYEVVVDHNTNDAADPLFNPGNQVVTRQFYRKTEVDTLLNNKQNTIADGDLTIAKTNGLQTALDNAGGGGGDTIRLLQQATDKNANNYTGNWGDAGGVSGRTDFFYQILTTDKLVLCYLDTSTGNTENEYPFLRLPLLSSVSDGHQVRVMNGTANGNVFVRTHVTDEPGIHNFASKIVKSWAYNGRAPTNAVEIQINSSYRVGTFVRFTTLSGDPMWYAQNIDTL